ncbi:MAG TPA: DUF885 domain-containing protein, partial [Gemmatimonadales bacterium]|nr:DUF885 domain-containing protein [Gemmatimonadales bacterium]
DRYFIRTLQLYPVTSTYLGGDGYSASLSGVNGMLRNWRPDALRSEGAFLREIERSRQAIDPAGLSPNDRIDHAVLGAQIGFSLHQIEDRRLHERAVDAYVAEPFHGVDWQQQQMEAGPDGQLGSEAEWDLVVKRLAAVPAYLATARDNLLAGKQAGNLPDRRLAQYDGVDGSTANEQYFRSALPAAVAGYLGRRPFAATILGRVTHASAGAADAFRDFATFLKSTYDLSEGVDRYAAGETEYDWRLEHCLHTEHRAADLWDYGAEQVAQYERAIFGVAKEVAKDAKLRLDFGSPASRLASVRAVMTHLSKDSPSNDDELFRWYRETGNRAVGYGREQRLFDVPATYRLEIVPTPPVLRSSIDATYYPAPPFKKSGVGRLYLTPTGNDPGQLKVNNRASVADTAVHEGFPGHDWHFKYMSQHATEISNIRWLTPGSVEDSAAMWEDSMATEGWGLYSEELMADPVPGRPHGFYTAAEHLYELQGQLLRAVRVRVDVGLHTGRMTFEQAVDYFTQHVQFFPGACAKSASDPVAKALCDVASRAIYRYSKWPTQAVTYNLGKNAIVSLREEVRRLQGARFALRAFHERLMRMGTIPAGYYREEFLRATSAS